MSEKHPAGGPGAKRVADSIPDEPSPFRLSALGPDGKPIGNARTGGDAPQGSETPDLLDAAGTPIQRTEPPAEIDAGAQELQARPADVAPARQYPDSPKTIVSERLPQWPTWSDGGLPPLIIYGPTPTGRPSPLADAWDRSPGTPPNDLPAAADELPAAEPPAAEPVAPEPDDHFQTFGSDDDAQAAAAQSPSPEWSTSDPDASTLPAETRAPADAAELDEIFDSIDEIAASDSSAPAMPYDAPRDASAGDDFGEDAAAEAHRADFPAEIPATLMGEVPDFSAYDLPPADAGETSEPPAGDDDALRPADLDAMPPETEPELAVSEAELFDSGQAVPVEPVMTTDVEPSPLELAAIPEEPIDALPVAAVAAGGAGRVAAPARDHDASHGQTAAQFFAHAHEDVEQRRGMLSLGLLTRLSGLGGLVATIAALSILLLACAGYSELTQQNIPLGRYLMKYSALYLGGFAVLLAVGAIFWKSWWPSAVTAAVSALALGGGWLALEQYPGHVAGFSLLSLSPYITYVGVGGLVLAIVGGLIEHRRLRQETAVLAAVFTNVLASLSGGVLWMLWNGMSLLGK